MATDPIRRFKTWWREAESAGCPLPEAMALATVDAAGKPSVRFVLLKGVEKQGFHFYTNERSRKGRDLQDNRAAALAFYWHETGRQARVEGDVALLGENEADRYWKTRPRGSQIASSVSQQSATLATRADLMREYRALERRYVDEPVPRPMHWRGYVLAPRRIEFWTRKEPRLHLRELFVRSGSNWSRQLLQP